jgi:hypothetical protein
MEIGKRPFDSSQRTGRRDGTPSLKESWSNCHSLVGVASVRSPDAYGRCTWSLRNQS